ASRPTASTRVCAPFLTMATTLGSLITTPSPRTCTSVLAVPRSMARSTLNMSRSFCSTKAGHSFGADASATRCATPALARAEGGAGSVVGARLYGGAALGWVLVVDAPEPRRPRGLSGRGLGRLGRKAPRLGARREAADELGGALRDGRVRVAGGGGE